MSELFKKILEKIFKNTETNSCTTDDNSTTITKREEPPNKLTWCMPVPKEYFIVSQSYLNNDPKLYPKFRHHTGVDYGGRRQTGIPLLACSDGEIIYRDITNSNWGIFLGNHAVLYIPSVNKSFLYCHMAKAPRKLGQIKSGEQIGIMGNTGKSAGNAIHLHIEGFHGRFDIALRSFNSLGDIKTKTFDTHQFINSYL